MHTDSRMANNSAAFTEKPDFEDFQAEMQSLYDSKCGESGIFFREAVKKKAEQIGKRSDPDHQPLRRKSLLGGDGQAATNVQLVERDQCVPTTRSLP